MRVLACPICSLPLSADKHTARCATNHCFDRAKSGYINLLVPKSSEKRHHGDTKTQLRHRDAFLGFGVFSPMIDLLARLAERDTKRVGAVVLDAGCGTGAHLDAFLRRCGETSASPSSYAFDISKDAIAMSARRLTETTCFVGDIWSRWPVLSETVDVVLNIFAPTSFVEMSRVLQRDGIAIKVFAGPNHLLELRERYDLIGVEDGKQARYELSAARSFGRVSHHAASWRTSLSSNQVAHLIGMGPNALHFADIQVDERATEVTFDLVILTCAEPLAGGEDD